MKYLLKATSNLCSMPMRAAVAVSVLATNSAHALTPTTGAPTLSKVLGETGKNIAAFGPFIETVAYIVATFLVFYGFYVIKQSRDQNNRDAKASTGITYVVIGVAIFAAPTIAGMLLGSTVGGGADTIKAPSTIL